LGRLEGRKWVRSARRLLEKSFLDLFPVAFWGGQKAENELSGLFDHLSHHLLDFNQVAFWYR
jgi:hypothetical protein